MVRDLTYAESLTVTDAMHVDVRSPGEFAEDHVPGAVNIPLFNDDERRSVGIIYRAQGREPAVLEGTNIVGGKLRSMVEGFQVYRDHTIIISCARGGMRSASVSSLLDSLGYRVCRVIGGYKGYRRWVIDALASLALDHIPPLFILQGLTGSGKTEVIRRMTQALDLEALAGHRSSVFGGMGLLPKTQKSLESGLIAAQQSHQNDTFLLVEAESRKIGNLHIPDPFYRMMLQAPAIIMETPLDYRVDVILREYGPAIDGDEVRTIVESISERLGKKSVDLLLELFNRGDLKGFVALLLEKYYDPLYRYSIDRRDYIGVVNYSGNADQAIDHIRKLIEGHIAANSPAP